MIHFYILQKIAVLMYGVLLCCEDLAETKNILNISKKWLYFDIRPTAIYRKLRKATFNIPLFIIS